MPDKEKRLRVGHRPADDRVTRSCDGCGQVDDHPRHVVGEADGSTSVYHLDCHNCIACVTQLDHARGKRGLELAEHLQTNGKVLARRVADALDDAANDAQED